jgi:nucleoside-diphosphate-sugar epimerase
MDHRLALVTGSTGFIGSKLTEILVSRGWSVRATVRQGSSTSHLDALGCEKTPLDLSVSNDSSQVQATARALEGVTHVFHLAGRVAGSAQQLETVNRFGTRRLMVAAAQAPNSPIVVLISSAAAGGPSFQTRPRSVIDPPQPVSNYGRSKLAGEAEALVFSDKYPLTIVRPGIVFGDGDREFIRIFRAMQQLRINPMIGRGFQPLGMIEVVDLVDLILRAAETGQRCQPNSHQSGVGIYNAADPKPMSLRDLGKVFRETTRRKPVDLPLPVAVGWFVGAVSELAGTIAGKAPTLNRDKIREAQAPGWALDCRSTLEQLGWLPRQPIDQQISQTLIKAASQGRL